MTKSHFSGLFFDTQGRYVDTPLNDCRISITLDQLRATPTVVAIAGGLDKVCARSRPTLKSLPHGAAETNSVNLYCLWFTVPTASDSMPMYSSRPTPVHEVPPRQISAEAHYHWP